MTTKIARHAGLVCTIGTLLIIAILAFVLGGCAHPNQPKPPQSEPIGADTVPRDSTLDKVMNQPAQPADNFITPSILTKGDESKTALAPQKRGFLGLFGRKVTKETVQNSPYPAKKCKGCVFNIVAGDQTNVAKKAQAAVGDGATSIVAAKKSTAVAADSGAAVNIAASKQGPAAAGEGIEQHQTTEKKTLAAYLVPAVCVAGGFGLLYWLLLGGGGTLLLALWRKNKPDNQA